MPEIVLGVLLTTLGWSVCRYLKSSPLRPNFRIWAWAGFNLLLTGFTLELIVSFIREGSLRAALVSGGLFMLVTSALWVMLIRLISLKNKSEKQVL